MTNLITDEENHYEDYLIFHMKMFFKDNGRSPKTKDFINSEIYPSHMQYYKYFGNWSKALKIAGLPVNVYRSYTGDEVCEICGCKKLHRTWYHKDDKLVCRSCYLNANYKTGKIDPSTNVGFKLIGKIIVMKHLHLKNKMCKINNSYDFINKKFGKVYVKSATEKEYIKNVNKYTFSIYSKNNVDTFILLGFSKDREEINHVWIVPSNAELFKNKKNKNGKTFIIKNDEKGLEKLKEFEVNGKPYNRIYKEYINELKS